MLQVSVGVSIFKGTAFHVEMANEAFLQIIGMNEKDFVGKNLFEIMPETQSIAEPMLYKVLTTGVPHHLKELEYDIGLPDNTEKGYYNLVYQPMFDESATITGIICITNDVTDVIIARKKMEAQATMVEDLLLNAPAFICILKGATHVYDLVNERYQSLFGKRKLQGKAMLDALPELVGQGIDTILDKVFDTGKPFVGTDILITLARDEGLTPQLNYFNFSCQPIYNEDKKINSILVFGYEVTEQVTARNKNLQTEQTHSKELEEKVDQRTLELIAANAMLKVQNEENEKRAEELIIANNELQAFNYISSHDLQEPLRKIQTFASLILDSEAELLSAKGKDYFNRMRDSANRMQTLIEDLLAYARTNEAERKIVNTDLNLIVGEVTEELSELIREKKAVIEIDKLCDAEVLPFQIRQVINNLLTNAIKFSQDDVAPRIKITAVKAASATFAKEIAKLSKAKLLEDQDYCRISVSDNGIGFNPKYKDKIFEVFQRLHVKEIYPGTGIGLAIVKKIVQNHNGIITAKGIPNEGATFNIYIPILLR